MRGNLLGAEFALGSAAAISFYNLMGKRLLQGMNPWTVTFYGFLFGGAALGGLWAAQGALVPALPAYGWGLILLLAVFPSILAYGLYLKALERMEASRAAIVATLEPVLSSGNGSSPIKGDATPRTVASGFIPDVGGRGAGARRGRDPAGSGHSGCPSGVRAPRRTTPPLTPLLRVSPPGHASGRESGPPR
ncbi:DMT family transporter [Candidatus Bipolaricaulota bacterium]|nr:DMT family transporter [Candidatus Bipolaricaulota bacterium]